jgi:hypothetical protein
MRFTVFKYLLLVSTISAFLTTSKSMAAQADFAPLFPFVISHEATENVTSMAHLLDAPAGKHGFVRVENGRFATDRGPIKFNATNLTGPANFPTHADADRLADRLARFGINCVRLHYFDSRYGNFREDHQRGIYGNGKNLPKAFSADPTIRIPFDQESVDRQDYLIAALKKRGIYVNMNLHVARFPKGRSFISSRMIVAEKEFAKELLTRVNPYTGLAYTHEPSVAMIEINNENGLFRQYLSGRLDNLPESYATEFRVLWNNWLKKKYGATAAMREAWNWKPTPLGNEQIVEGDFDQAVKADGGLWSFDLGSGKAAAAADNGVLRITVESEGKEYFPKLYRNGIRLKKGEPYTISFRIRRLNARNSVELGTAVAVTRGGWRSMGLLRRIKVDPQWTTLNASFVAADDCKNAQFQLTRFKPGVYELDDLSLQSGAESELTSDQNIEEGTVLPLKSKGFAAVAVKRDFYRFLTDTGRAYWREIDDYVKHELKAIAPVSGTQLGYSTPFLQAELDYIDTHAYWCHPKVGTHWTIGNSSMVNSMSLMQTFASQRIFGKPFTVSEYNHPFPNCYGAEGQPMLRAYGALQGWDGVFEYTWHHRKKYSPGWNSYFFSISERSDVLAHMPACAAIYLRGDVRESQRKIAAAADYESFFERLVTSGATRIGIKDAGFDRFLTLIHRTGIDLSGGSGTAPSDVNQGVAESKIMLSDTGELCWNREQSGAAYFTVNTAGTKLFTGFPQGRDITLGDVLLKIAPSRLNWATISLVSREVQSGFGENGESARILLAATGMAGNSGMELETVDSGRVRAKNSEWGGAPYLLEGITAVIDLPSGSERTRCYALDPNGERKMDVPVAANGSGCRVAIAPEYQTIWYEIEVREE